MRLLTVRTTLVSILRQRAVLLAAEDWERRHAAEERQRHRAEWICIEDAVDFLGDPGRLIDALGAGKLSCRWRHPARWWQAPWTVPSTVWAGASIKDAKLWRNGVCLESDHQLLVINVDDLLRLAGSAEPAALPAEILPPAAVKKKSNAGAPPQHDWEEAALYAEQLLGKLGDPYDPQNTQDGWRSNADVARSVIEHMQKVDPDRDPPDQKTVERRIRPIIEKLRKP